MGDIWTFVEQKLKATVPAYFKSVLNVCGYSNGISISLIEAEDLSYIENEVKSGNIATAIIDAGGEKEFLKDCTRKAENFEFVLGHKKFLLAIVNFLKNFIAENGADSLILDEKPSKTRKNQRKTSSKAESNEKNQQEKRVVLPSRNRVGKRDPRVMGLVRHGMSTKLELQKKSSTISIEILEEHRQVVLERTMCSVIRLTPELCDENIETIKEKISSDFLSFELDPGLEDTIAILTCVYCPKTVTVYLRPTPTNPKIWKTTNFDRHLRIIHRFENNSPDDSDLQSDTESKKSVKTEKRLQKKSSDLDVVVGVRRRDGDETMSDLDKDVVVVGQDGIATMNDLDDVVQVAGQHGNETMNDLGGVVEAAGNQKETLNEFGKKGAEVSDGQNKQKETIVKMAGQDKRLEILKIEEDTEMNLMRPLQEFPVMRNGFKTRHGNNFIVTTRTCAFDTIMNSFASICSQNFYVREQLDRSQSKMSQLLKSFLNQAGESTSNHSQGHSNDMYAMRNTILKEIYEGWCKSDNIQKNNDTTFIDCKTGIGSLFAKMCKAEENFASAIYERTCKKCGTSFKKVMPFLKTNNKVRNLGKIAEYLDVKPQERECLTCKSKCKAKMYYNNVIVLETEPPTKHRNQTIALQNITPEMNIGTTPYKLYAVMHFEAKIDHFVAFIRDRSNNWICFDDLKKNVLKVIAGTDVNPFILCYASTVRQFDFEKSIQAKSTRQSVQTIVPSLEERPNSPHQAKCEQKVVPELATKPALPAIQSEENLEEKKRKKRKKRHSSKNKKKKIE